mmetsp:Transcript_101043/g.184377  ORF Transcript_101043/g.184377 Transcript_101043/m.184377 type:complete len:227 (+) Transcript_101043:3-683(+)
MMACGYACHDGALSPACSCLHAHFFNFRSSPFTCMQMSGAFHVIMSTLNVALSGILRFWPDCFRNCFAYGSMTLRCGPSASCVKLKSTSLQSGSVYSTMRYCCCTVSFFGRLQSSSIILSVTTIAAQMVSTSEKTDARDCRGPSPWLPVPPAGALSAMISSLHCKLLTSNQTVWPSNRLSSNLITHSSFALPALPPIVPLSFQPCAAKRQSTPDNLSQAPAERGDT